MYYCGWHLQKLLLWWWGGIKREKVAFMWQSYFHPTTGKYTCKKAQIYTDSVLVSTIMDTTSYLIDYQEVKYRIAPIEKE